MANPVINCYSYVNILNIAFLKIALITHFFTNWSSPFYLPASLLLKIALLRNTSIFAKNRLILL